MPATQSTGSPGSHSPGASRPLARSGELGGESGESSSRRVISSRSVQAPRATSGRRFSHAVADRGVGRNAQRRNRSVARLPSETWPRIGARWSSSSGEIAIPPRPAANWSRRYPFRASCDLRTSGQRSRSPAPCPRRHSQSGIHKSDPRRRAESRLRQETPAPVRSTSAGSRSRPSASARRPPSAPWISEPPRSATTAIPRASRPLVLDLLRQSRACCSIGCSGASLMSRISSWDRCSSPATVGRLDGEKPKPVRTKGRDSLALDESA